MIQNQLGCELKITEKAATVYKDMVTEMKKIKHHFDKGIRARIGIEF